MTFFGIDDEGYWDDAALAQFYPGGEGEYRYVDGDYGTVEGEAVPPQQEELPVEGEHAEQDDYGGAQESGDQTGSSWEHVPEHGTSGDTPPSYSADEWQWQDPWGSTPRGQWSSRSSRPRQQSYNGNEGWGSYQQQSYDYAQSGVNVSRDQHGRADDHGGGLN